MIWRSWFQSPLGAIFDKFFCPSLCKDLSDNLTETAIVKNSNYLIISSIRPYVAQDPQISQITKDNEYAKDLGVKLKTPLLKSLVRTISSLFPCGNIASSKIHWPTVAPTKLTVNQTKTQLSIENQIINIFLRKQLCVDP